MQNGDGTWSVLAQDLAGVSLVPPSGYSGTLEGVQIGTRILDNDSQPSDRVVTIDVTIAPAGGDTGGGTGVTPVEVPAGNGSFRTRNTSGQHSDRR